MVAAAAAVVARLIRRPAFRTLPAHESIWQKRSDLRIVKLLDQSLLNEARFPNRLPDLRAERVVVGTVRTAVIVEPDIERGKILLVPLLHLGYEVGLAAACLPRADHHRRAVR